METRTILLSLLRLSKSEALKKFDDKRVSFGEVGIMDTEKFNSPTNTVVNLTEEVFHSELRCLVRPKVGSKGVIVRIGAMGLERDNGALTWYVEVWEEGNRDEVARVITTSDFGASYDEFVKTIKSAI